MYYKAEIFLSTEQMEYDEKEQAYIGHDPDTFQEHGLVETITGSSLEKVKAELTRKFDLKNAILFDGALELQYDGEHDYRTPIEEQIPFTETMRIIFSKVEENTVDVTTIFPELKES